MKVSILVDDGTGVITCCCWKDAIFKQKLSETDKESIKLSLPPCLYKKAEELVMEESRSYSLGDCIQVRGRIKVFREKREIVASYHNPNVKDLLVRSLLNTANLHTPSQHDSSTPPSSTSSSTCTSSGSETSVPSCPSPPPCTEESASEKDLEPNNNIHSWKPNEEDMLVSLRHEKNDKFMKSKNHTELWKEISCDLLQKLKCNVTPLQANNKYNNLKKRWKEVIDAGTGTEAKYFRQRDAFDEMYGTKASSKPAFTLDSGRPSCSRDDNSSDTDPPLPACPSSNIQTKKDQASKGSKGKKRKCQDVIEFLQKSDKDFKETITNFHAEKMQRFDRFLDLLEKKVNNE
ncbi:hypothetical protein FSP39_015637 [Pinctada imbricata]|uniref:CST complex subunit STN1 n=1 Tax=Pinctada imbricata TaxID=66713 RepID=A0AA88XGB1_PINIB|nr:hypothetical protein FSP39_015637 [Pinctada imbricata]